jgi:hypothetical protein
MDDSERSGCSDSLEGRKIILQVLFHTCSEMWCIASFLWQALKDFAAIPSEAFSSQSVSKTVPVVD